MMRKNVIQFLRLDFSLERLDTGGVINLVDYNAADVLALLPKLRLHDSESLESETVEFKAFKHLKALHNDKSLVGELCAFANHLGGVLVVGVQDSSNLPKQADRAQQLVGFDTVDTTELEQRLRGQIQGPIDLRVENIKFKFDSKNYVAIYIVRDLEHLVMTTSGKVYIREGRSSRPMRPDEIKRAIASMPNYDWSAEVLASCPIRDTLDTADVKEAFDKYLKIKSLSPPPTHENFLEAVGITRNGYLTRGGLLFLGKKNIIQDKLGNYEFRFTWREGIDLKVNEVWSGNLWQSIKQAKAHFLKCVEKKQIEIKANQFSVENLDSVAFNEAFLNAIVHRDYGVDGMVVIDFCDLVLSVTSPGVFYGGVTADNIAVHQPRHRNKSLARILMDYGLVDRAGAGVKRMSIKSLIYGRKFPHFEEVHDSVRVSMQAEHISTPIFMLTHGKQDKNLHLHDLVLLNILHKKSYCSVYRCMQEIKNLTPQPWQGVQDCVQRWSSYIDFYANKQDVFVAIRDEMKEFFELARSFRPPANSNKLVQLFMLLCKYEKVSAHDIAQHLEMSNISRFLQPIEWAKRAGNGKGTFYQLKEKISP